MTARVADDKFDLAVTVGRFRQRVVRRQDAIPCTHPTRTTPMTQRLRPAVTDPVILMFSRRQVETGDVDEPLELPAQPDR